MAPFLSSTHFFYESLGSHFSAGGQSPDPKCLDNGNTPTSTAASCSQQKARWYFASRQRKPNRNTMVCGFTPSTATILSTEDTVISPCPQPPHHAVPKSQLNSSPVSANETLIFWTLNVKNLNLQQEKTSWVLAQEQTQRMEELGFLRLLYKYILPLLFFHFLPPSLPLLWFLFFSSTWWVF